MRQSLAMYWHAARRPSCTEFWHGYLYLHVLVVRIRPVTFPGTSKHWMLRRRGGAGRSRHSSAGAWSNFWGRGKNKATRCSAHHMNQREISTDSKRIVRTFLDLRAIPHRSYAAKGLPSSAANGPVDLSHWRNWPTVASRKAQSASHTVLEPSG